MIAAGTALAQTAAQVAAPLSPPKPGKVDNPPVVVTILVLLLMVAMVIGAMVIPAKRGHQD